MYGDHFVWTGLFASWHHGVCSFATALKLLQLLSQNWKPWKERMLPVHFCEKGRNLLQCLICLQIHILRLKPGFYIIQLCMNTPQIHFV